MIEDADQMRMAVVKIESGVVIDERRSEHLARLLSPPEVGDVGPG
jgi:hypothetical protein